MIAVVRLYRQHDLDLITLYYNENIQLGRLIKKVLLNYVSETDEPMVLNFEEPESTTGYIPKCVRIHINLNESSEVDRKVIALLKEIKSGYRCSFIKALFRNTCTYLPMVAYTEGSDFVMRKTLKAVTVLDPAPVKEVKVPEVTKSKSIEVQPASVPVVAPILPKSVEPDSDVKALIKEPAIVEELAENLDDMFDSFNKLG